MEKTPKGRRPLGASLRQRLRERLHRSCSRIVEAAGHQNAIHDWWESVSTPATGRIMAGAEQAGSSDIDDNLSEVLRAFEECESFGRLLEREGLRNDRFHSVQVDRPIHLSERVHVADVGALDLDVL